MSPLGHSFTEALHTVTLLIYICQMNPPGQLSIVALHTITLFIYIERR